MPGYRCQSAAHLSGESDTVNIAGKHERDRRLYYESCSALSWICYMSEFLAIYLKGPIFRVYQMLYLYNIDFLKIGTQYSLSLRLSSYPRNCF
jgi:hypothetical protein